MAAFVRYSARGSGLAQLWRAELLELFYLAGDRVAVFAPSGSGGLRTTMDVKSGSESSSTIWTLATMVSILEQMIGA